MQGKHHILVQSAHLKYELDVKRNITIIKGDSATGKTTLADMIREYVLNGSDTGISVSCDVPCRLIEGNTWHEQLNTITQSIVFIDEGNSFVVSKDFANAVKESTNYFVIITRENLHALPYSVNEIYGIRSSGKYNKATPTYHELYNIYGADSDVKINPETIIVEDSNSGYDFFQYITGSDTKCISANGKDNIFNMLTSGNYTGNILVIADGAAFGAQMSNLNDLSEHNDSLNLYLPESFEWIILDSDILNDAELRKILQAPEDYVSSDEYFSWERYFTALLIQKSDDTYLKYNKHSLNPNYFNEKIITKIKEVLPTNIYF